MTREEIKTFIQDNRILSNREIARRVGVTETTIRKYKKDMLFAEIGEGSPITLTVEEVKTYVNYKLHCIKRDINSEERFKVHREDILWAVRSLLPNCPHCPNRPHII